MHEIIEGLIAHHSVTVPISTEPQLYPSFVSDPPNVAAEVVEPSGVTPVDGIRGSVDSPGKAVGLHQMLGVKGLRFPSREELLLALW